MTRSYAPVAIALFVASLTPAANAQLLSDRADGLSRLCTYAGATNVVSGSPTRTLRVGIGQNCPFNYPPALPGQLPAPPTAQLRTETVTENARVCAYEQAGTTWTLAIEITRSCPLFAGMIPQAVDPAQRQMTSPAPLRQPATPDRRRGDR